MPIGRCRREPECRHRAGGRIRAAARGAVVSTVEARVRGPGALGSPPPSTLHTRRANRRRTARSPLHTTAGGGRAHTDLSLAVIILKKYIYIL